MPTTDTPPAVQADAPKAKGRSAARPADIQALAERVAALEAATLKPQGYRDVIAAVETVIRGAEVREAVDDRISSRIQDVLRYSTPHEMQAAIASLVAAKSHDIVALMMRQMLDDTDVRRAIAGVAVQMIRETLPVEDVVAGKVEAMFSDGYELPVMVENAIGAAESALVRRLERSPALREGLAAVHRQWMAEQHFRLVT